MEKNFYDEAQKFINNMSDSEMIKFADWFFHGESYPTGANAESWNFAQCLYDNFFDDEEVYDRDGAERFIFDAVFECRFVYNRIKTLIKKEAK